MTDRTINAEHYPGETRDLTRNLAGSGQMFGLDKATRAGAEAAYKSGNLPRMRDASAAVTDWLRLNGGPDDIELSATPKRRRQVIKSPTNPGQR